MYSSFEVSDRGWGGGPFFGWLGPFFTRCFSIHKESLHLYPRISSSPRHSPAPPYVLYKHSRPIVPVLPFSPSIEKGSRSWPWANISQSCAELCLHATRRKPTHSVGCWIGVKLLRALTFACLWLNTTVGALNLIVSSESAIYVANPSTSFRSWGLRIKMSIWDMSKEDRWDGVSYVDILKKTSGFVWMCHRWCSDPHSDTNFIPRWISFWKSSGELDVKFIR